MADFMIRFFICNLLISGIIGVLSALKHILKNIMSSRMHYRLWFLLLGLLAVPFIPLRRIGFLQIFPLFGIPGNFSASDSGNAFAQTAGAASVRNADWLNDFALSVNNKTPFITGYILSGIWLAGIFVMILLSVRSFFRLQVLKQSALPLQNIRVRRLYQYCLKELEIKKEIPIYSTAFLKSPIITGLIRPCIYLPIHLLPDLNEPDALRPIRYMLLHELQHYKHKDAVANALMNLARIVYWFNPAVWFALSEMRNDREIACDTSVLELLEEDFYEDYGNTLIQFAKKISVSPFSCVSSLSGNKKQITRRIINIASYEKPALRQKLKSLTAFVLTAALLLGPAPILSADAAQSDHYKWDSSHKKISIVDLSAYFGKYDGSFILYDQKQDVWSIYNMEHAALRTAPDSTYKIYDALFGLEEGVITPDDSLIAWDGENHPFEAWNADQTLRSAMQSSVNWYFQEIDARLGAASVDHYIRKIGYGNENISGGLSDYWVESSLKISPIEQVELLTALYDNRLDFAPENIHAVRDALLLASSKTQTLYGKTGTGEVDGQNVNGWFVGYVETAENTCFFAANINADEDAAGSNAAEITMSILSDLNIGDFRM